VVSCSCLCSCLFLPHAELLAQ